MKKNEDLGTETLRHIRNWQEEGARLREERIKQPKNTENDLDPWQKDAVEGIADGKHVIVDAPTSAGKTRVVEAIFKVNLQNPEFRAVYTTPVKSLSNDKVREFRQMFGEKNVGISTGDIKENLHAPIVVATLESYRNSLLGIEPDLGRTIAVFDEYHYLQDESRGSAWEEAIILTPPSCQLLMLSASVENSGEFCEWLQKIGKRPAVVVQTLVRPVPLTNLVYINKQWILADLVPPRDMAPQGRGKDYYLPYESIVERLPSLLDMELTPCILYAGKRLACENIATLIAKKLKPIPEENRRNIGDILQQMNKELNVLTFLSPGLRQMIQVYGIAYHHSGLAPPVRMTIEKLVKEGLLRFCVATMGLSLGINFSVRSTMITDFMRPGEPGPVNYSPSEVLQMLGRAGRRGKDIVGYSLWPAPDYYRKMSGAKRERTHSKLKQDPTTFLGLVGRGMSIGAIENLYGKSFLKHQDKNFDLRLIQKPHVQNKLGETDIPCESPAAEVTRFWAENQSSLCFTCPFQKKCHNYVEFRSGGMLAILHIHLHGVEALTKDDSLTAFGSCARYFPQTGGMLIAKYLVDQTINDQNILEGLQLMASLCMASFKEPRVPESYRFPFSPKKTLKELENYYPHELFPDLYDSQMVFKEFNPAAGYIVREWVSQKINWPTLHSQISTEAIGSGDIMGLIYRTATFMQSIIQADIPGLSDSARKVRELLLREPLNVTI